MAGTGQGGVRGEGGNVPPLVLCAGSTAALTVAAGRELCASAFRQVRVLSASRARLHALVLYASKWYRGRDRQAQLVRAGWLLSVPVYSAEL